MSKKSVERDLRLIEFTSRNKDARIAALQAEVDRLSGKTSQLEDDTRRARIAEYIDRRMDPSVLHRSFYDYSSRTRVRLLIRLLEEAEKEVGRGS